MIEFVVVVKPWRDDQDRLHGHELHILGLGVTQIPGFSPPTDEQVRQQVADYLRTGGHPHSFTLDISRWIDGVVPTTATPIDITAQVIANRVVKISQSMKKHGEDEYLMGRMMGYLRALALICGTDYRNLAELLAGLLPEEEPNST